MDRVTSTTRSGLGSDVGGCAEGKVSGMSVLMRWRPDQESGYVSIQGSGYTPHTSLKCLLHLRRDRPFSSKMEPCNLTYSSYSRFPWEFISINCRDPFINSFTFSINMHAGRKTFSFQRQAVAFLELFHTFCTKIGSSR